MDLNKEIFAFNLFRELYGQLPPGEKSERPDFIISKDGSKIGIELTELMDEEYGGSSLAAKYSSEDKIVKLSRINFDLLTNKRIFANLHFRDKLKIKSNRKEQISREIATILVNTTNNYPNVLIHNLEINDNLPNELLNIYFDIAPFLEDSHFMAMRGKWTGPFNINELNRIVEKKDKNLFAYKTRTDQVYLVIIEGFIPNSMYGEFLNSGTLIKNGFDKVFLLRIMSKKLFEIK